MARFTVTLADKPRDLLVSLVEDGPQTAGQLSERFEGRPLYAGGLSLLLELGLADFERRSAQPPTWSATDDGRQLVERARQGGDA